MNIQFILVSGLLILFNLTLSATAWALDDPTGSIVFNSKRRVSVVSHGPNSVILYGGSLFQAGVPQGANAVLILDRRVPNMKACFQLAETLQRY